MKHEESPQRNREMRLTWHTYGYLAAILFIGVVLGLLAYPLLTYPAIWAWGLLGIALLLIAVTAPLIRR